MISSSFHHRRYQNAIVSHKFVFLYALFIKLCVHFFALNFHLQRKTLSRIFREFRWLNESIEREFERGSFFVFVRIVTYQIPKQFRGRIFICRLVLQDFTHWQRNEMEPNANVRQTDGTRETIYLQIEYTSRTQHTGVKNPIMLTYFS